MKNIDKKSDKNNKKKKKKTIQKVVVFAIMGVMLLSTFLTSLAFLL